MRNSTVMKMKSRFQETRWLQFALCFMSTLPVMSSWAEGDDKPRVIIDIALFDKHNNGHRETLSKIPEGQAPSRLMLALKEIMIKKGYLPIDEIPKNLDQNAPLQAGLALKEPIYLDVSARFEYQNSSSLYAGLDSFTYRIPDDFLPTPEAQQEYFEKVVAHQKKVRGEYYDKYDKTNEGVDPETGRSMLRYVYEPFTNFNLKQQPPIKPWRHEFTFSAQTKDRHPGFLLVWIRPLRHWLMRRSTRKDIPSSDELFEEMRPLFDKDFMKARTVTREEMKCIIGLSSSSSG